MGASEEVESREEVQETVAVEAALVVNYQEAAFRVAKRLKEDEFPLEDGRVAVVVADDTTLRENDKKSCQALSKRSFPSKQHGRPRVQSPSVRWETSFSVLKLPSIFNFS